MKDSEEKYLKNFERLRRALVDFEGSEQKSFLKFGATYILECSCFEITLLLFINVKTFVVGLMLLLACGPGYSQCRN